MQGAVGVDRLLAAAEDDGVAALDAERGGVDGDVGPALVDHEDDAERHADLADLQAVRPPAATDDLADGVGKAATSSSDLGHLVDPAGIQRQAIDGRRVQPQLGSRRHVASIGLENLVATGSQAVAERCQPVVLGRPLVPAPSAGGRPGWMASVAAECLQLGRCRSRLRSSVHASIT